MNPNSLKGKKVVGSEGYILGEIDDLYVDLETWQATAFYVNLSNDAIAELGFKKSRLHKIVICLPTKLIKAVGDIVTLTQPLRNVKDIEENQIQMTPNKLEGKKVVSVKGNTIGQAEGFDVDTDNWQVTGLDVSLTDQAATD